MDIKKFSERFLNTAEKKRKFAEKVKVSYVSINNYISGRRIPKREVIKRITEATGGKLVANSFYI